MAIVGLIAVLIGFGKTFIVPVAEGKFSAPVVIQTKSRLELSSYFLIGYKRAITL